jgi:hypothetical protein
MNALKSDEFVKRPHAAWTVSLISRPTEQNVVVAMGILAAKIDYAIISLMPCPLSESPVSRSDIGRRISFMKPFMNAWALAMSWS